MILYAASLLLLVAVVPNVAIPTDCLASACRCTMDVVKKRCKDSVMCTKYQDPVHVAQTSIDPKETLQCKDVFPTPLWVINGNEYKKGDDLICTPNGTHYEWRTQDEVVVYDALCIAKKSCEFTGNLDTTSTPRLIQPFFNASTRTEMLTCAGESKLHVIASDDSTRRVKRFKVPFVCDASIGKWKTNLNNQRFIPDKSLVWCEVPDDDDAIKAALTKDEEAQDAGEKEGQIWLMPLLSTVGFVLILAISTPVAFLLLKITYRKRKTVVMPTVEVWSPHWEEYEESLDWNWKIVTDFMQNWHKYPVAERAAFLERGYAELGYQSTITQMLFIFEYMLIVENHHLVWRPMINFLIRLKRLASPTYTEIDLSQKFHIWLGVQGRKLLDEFGLHPWDAPRAACTDSDCTRSACSLSSESESESDDGGHADTDSGSGSCSCSDDGHEGERKGSKKEGKEERKGKVDTNWAKKEDKKEAKAPAKEAKKEDKKNDKKDAKGDKKAGEKRGAAGAESAEAKPAEATAIAPSSGGEQAKPAETPAAPQGPRETVEGGGDLEDEDPHDAYLRYIGVFLLTLGSGGRDKIMYEDLDECHEGMNIEGPVRAALAAYKITKEGDSEFERIWSRLSDDGGEEEGKSEWGSLTEHYFFALGHIVDEDKVAQLTDFLVKGKTVKARHIMWWFRGANERNSHHHLAFLLTNHKNESLDRKLPIESDEFYECLRMYCLFDRTTSSWNRIERLVYKNPKLAKRLNVPDYRRRSQHFTSHYLDQGEHELTCWLADPDRTAEIDAVDFQPMSNKVLSKRG